MISSEPIGGTIRVAGSMVGQLDLGGQFVLWAVRQRASAPTAEVAELAGGFQLACGLAHVEQALAAFVDWFDLLARHGRPPLAVAPLRCACLTSGERTLLDLLGAAQAPRGSRSAGLATRLVAPHAVAAVIAASARLADALTDAGLEVGAAAAARPEVRH